MMVMGSDYSSYSTTVSIETFSQWLSAPFLCLDTFKEEFQLLQGHFQISAQIQLNSFSELQYEFWNLCLFLFVKIKFYTLF